MKQENLPVPLPRESGDELSIVALLDALFDNKTLIGVVAALFIVVGGLYAFLAAPVYSSRILVAVEDSPDASGAKDLLGDVSAMFDVKSSADGEIQILGSRLVTSRTVEALKLYIEAQPIHFPLVGRWIAAHSDGLSTPGLLGLGGFDWGRESIDVATFDVPRVLEGQSFRLVVLTGGKYQLSGVGFNNPVVGDIGRTEQFKSDVGTVFLNVSRIAGRPGAAFKLTRHSAQLTTEELGKSLQILEQGKHSGVIAATLEATDAVFLSETLNELGSQYVKQNADRKAEQAQHSILFLEKQLPLMKQQLEDAESRLSEYQNAHTIIDLSEAGKVILQQSADADTKLVTLKQKREELATRFGPAHPALRVIDEQIVTTQRQIDGMTAQIRQMPLTEQGVLKLERDVRVATDLYIAMRSNIEQLRLVKAGKIGNVRLVDTADISERPVKPRKLALVLASAVMGLFVGALLALVKDRLFTGVTDPAVLEEHTGLSVYATIPYSEAQGELATREAQKLEQHSVLATLHPQDPAIESLRSLRTALQFAMLGAQNNVVLITGPTPGVGKSFLSVNLAAVLATAGKRILLIDADLRKGHLNQYFGLSRENGLADAIAKGQSLESVKHCDVLPNLDLVVTGTYPPNPAELLLHNNWTEFVTAASRKYDLVIVDAPPVLAVSDAGIVSSAAGTVFVVTRFAFTRSGDVVESVKRLTQVGTRVTGLLFNSVKPRGGVYGYGGRYGNYRYSSYNYQDQT